MSQVFTDEAEKLIDETFPPGYARYVREMGQTMKDNVGTQDPMVVNYQYLTVPIPEWNDPDSDRTVTLFDSFQFGNVQNETVENQREFD